MKKIVTYLIIMVLTISMNVSPVLAKSRTSKQVRSTTQKTMALNTTITDKINHYDDVNLYKITIPKTGYFQVNFNHDYIDVYGLSYWRMTIYNNQMEKLTEYEEVYAYQTNTKTPKIGIDAGTYYIKVTSQTDSSIGLPYRLNVSYKVASNWETEFNDTTRTADSIKFNQTIYGTEMEYEDNDYYKIKVPTAGYMDISVTHAYREYKGFGDFYWYTIVYNSRINELKTKTIFPHQTKTQTGKIKVNPGTYYIRMKPNSTQPKGVVYGLRATYQFYNRNPKITSLKKGKKKAYLKWWKVSGSQGYEVYMSRKKNSGYKKIKTTKSLKYTKKGLKKKKYYYFKVRAYKYSNGKKTFTPFSPIKRVKTK
ncbi:hypothetical protein [Anaerostipes sp.]|uniref:hypothetical protein n=1 Tax=Anaerostipes sp. TaxID=1872530 RepID=UPI0025B9CC87|nr:hypothetical protein [Anaerostipes sp.]MBS7008290.1 hypothetical protein [Anaerostipes sp.]